MDDQHDAGLLTPAPCSCERAGKCDRFATRMSAASHALCQSSPAFRAKMELRLAEGPKPPRRDDAQAVPPADAGGPGLLQLAVNAAKAVGRAAKAAVKGEPVLVPPEVALARKAVCETNECGYFDAAKDRCLHKKCGCKLSGKTLALGLKRPGKVECAQESCPAGYWPAYTVPATDGQPPG